MCALGLAWGLTIPMTRVAVSTGHHPIGLIAWQSILLCAVLGAAVIVRRGRFALSRGALKLYAVIAVFGTLVPNLFSFSAARHLPAGIMAIVIALVPMFALPLSLALGLERFRPARLVGLVLGALAVALIALPEASLPAPGLAIWVAIALIAPLCYAIEGNVLALSGAQTRDPIELLWGASMLATLLAVPIAVGGGTWIDPRAVWGAAEAAFLLATAMHLVAYCGYVWLVGAAGAVFAAQVAYVVTAAGVLWAMLLLGERYALWIWLAFALMLVGLSLVQPRRAGDAGSSPGSAGGSTTPEGRAGMGPAA